MVRWVKKVYKMKNKKGYVTPYMILPAEFREWIGKSVSITVVGVNKIEVELEDSD